MNEIIDSEESDNDDKEDSSKQVLNFKYRSGKIRPYFKIEKKRLLPFIKINSNEESKQRFNNAPSAVPEIQKPPPPKKVSTFTSFFHCLEFSCH